MNIPVLRLLLVALLLACPAAAWSLSTSYDLTSGQITSVQFLDASGAAVPCPIGSSTSCLSNAPVALDSGTIVLDEGSLSLDSLTLSALGPGVLDMGGLNGISTVTFTDASFTSSGPTAITLAGTSGSTQIYNFGPVPGTFGADLAITDTGGGVTTVSGFTAAGSPAGQIFADSGTLALNLQGVNLGQICDAQGGGCLYVKADFSMTAQQAAPPIPEPQAFLVFAAGALLVGAARGRRTAA